MYLFKRLVKNLVTNKAELYSLFVIVVAVPVSVGFLAGFKWALLLSFVLQAIIGVFYIRGKM